MKKNFRVLCFSLAFGLLSSMTAFAEQSDRWYSDENGTWFLMNEAGTGNVVNSWFQDLDGSWYLLAPEDGHMYAGLIHDTLTDRWYYCQVEHDGYYGRMAHKDGVYTINNQQIHLTFNQSHDGTFGALTSNIDALKSTGIPLVDVAGLPVNSAKASEEDKSSHSDTVVTDVDTDTPTPTPTGGDRSSLDKQAEDLLADVDWSTGTSTGFDGRNWIWH